ncbi:glycosyltransferase family 2 protein [Bacillus sp. H-16]|uniref:glycosyltransferase family 2 protein n=1 Tax=Alteribacter salitolerans TaxID=2912333 RepID=UPI0019625C29|nr:glycosyltransferase family 2 protein [Alteribacter salitolerans]MBM7097267.1 glycosyltransferase family 2 protein [Alteribacter salitolerans]
MKVDVVIPAYNEEKNIGETLSALRNEDWVSRILVIDDGSTDKTSRIAFDYTDYVYRFHINQGKAQAAITGLKQTKSDYVMLLDADLKSTAKHAFNLLRPLKMNEADVTVAMLPPDSANKGFGLMKRRAQRVLERRFQVHMTSPLSGQRAFHRRWLKSLSEDVRHSRYGFEMACNLDLLKNGAVIKEVPVKMEHHAYGKTMRGMIHRARQWYEMERILWHRTSGNLY